ncbi:C4-dicarboxylate ABC transporter [Vibrio sp. 10N.286.49.C2]|uniref:TRAP transporter large permease n=1 Tax=unclassified Vibrio TaxID=2614977 RepID=UPI000C845DB3|nr:MULTISPECIES: TRAP transporter large permease [unclassified Vibrio]PMH42905.1 C4-dicarboxylate ABC transporter [Vibrio sp. 10N.286.49.C2]PMH53756.1 C4-dicarboxylate ABC transporter [Vibrio sp. 10N.286.49.B1]PMH77770.1 C4-dicarboxylate ABC transporter [Vibrio sp. 10N.286.48.B7]
MLTLALLLFAILLVFGVPVFFTMGITSTFYILTHDIPAVVLSHRIFSGLDSFTIMAIPFFVLSGLLMEKGGIAERIIQFFTSLIGWISGSLLYVSTLTGTGLAAISGSGSADTAAISSIMLPEMRNRNYNIDFSAGIMACAGTLGPILPPSIMMIVIATLTGTSVGAMFLAGIFPGFLMVLVLLFACRIHVKNDPGRYQAEVTFSLRKLAFDFVRAIPAFLMPVIIVGGIVSGVFTPTEAAAIAVVVGFIVGLLVYKELTWSGLPALIAKATKISAVVMIIIATASIFSWIISSQNIPAVIKSAIDSVTSSPITFLLAVNILLLVIGMFMESISAILILVPILMPMAQSYGIDPVHFNIIVVVNLAVGMVTPPYGITLFVASSISQRNPMIVAKETRIPLLGMLLALQVITYFPLISTYLPNAIMG